MEINRKKSTISEIVATARIYAIISVTCAHLSFADSIIGDLFIKIGTIGVIVFLISSGYYFVPAKFNNLFDLIKKKIKSICIPWIILGTLVWVYNMILSPKFRSPLGYLKWIMGNGTYLYYIPILMVCFLLCYKASQKVLVGMVALNILSIILTAMGFLNPVIEALHITNYLNFFNWIGFFALGMLLRGVSEEKIQNFLLKVRLPILVLFVTAVCLAVKFRDKDFTYFSFVAIPYELLGSLAVFSISTLPLVRVKFLGYLSDCTYAIYLIHMIFIGLLDSIFGKFLLLQAIAPLAVVFAVYMLLMLGNIISEKLKINSLYCLFTGLRIKK